MISIGNLQINKLCLGDVEVSKAYLGDVEVYNSNQKYMTMTVLDGDAGTTIAPTITGTLTNTPNLQYRINNGSWNDFIVGTTADIHAVAGDVVQWKGVNESGISTSSSNYMNFSISGNPVTLSGNVMSLIDGVGDVLVIPNDYCFYRLFQGSSIKTVSHDFLPATELTNGCYFDLFNASLLENAPELPALIMKEHCYRGMFYGCQHFTQAPELPANTLAIGCYAFIFGGCSSLVQVPVLPATELAPECYRGLFQNCTALVTAPELPATILVERCYRQMFYGCTSLTTAPELPATTLAVNCYNAMFYGCNSLTQAPVLPAKTLAEWCYAYMFQGCTSLTTAPELPATTLVNYCYNNMFNGDSNLNYVKSLATNITATSALYNWLNGVSTTGTFVKPIGVGYPTGASGIPSGWTIVEEKPKPEGKYMTITVDDSAGETIISPTINGSLTPPNLQYRINSNGDWTNFIVGTTADIHVVAGDWVQFKGVNESGISTSSSNYMNFSISGNPVALSGNVMSLIDGIGDTLVIPNNYCFYRLFQGSSIKTVSSDFLPATTLKNYCYQRMFYGCTSLTTAPELNATNIADYCYERMFYGCISLTTAPELPATTIKTECYASMFRECTSLVQAPSLPATTLANYCYYELFSGCTSLVQAPALPATTLANSCYNSMFSVCTSLVQAPDLPATTLANNCYAYMFSGCSNLNYIKSLATNITATGALNSWLNRVATTGTFVKPRGVSYPSGASGIPEGWTIQNI